MPSERPSATSAKDATTAFFTALAERGHEPLLAGSTGTLRFDLTRGRSVEHWFVSINRGDLAVSRKESRADAVVRLDRDFFGRLVTGRANAMAATLRGVLVPQGDLGLMMSFQRLFPGPPASRRRARTSGTAGRTR